jgi:dipeptidyl aminopeptidase/acylaminoacyl peptidase
MTDIHDRFRSLDDLDVPDVYARARAMGPKGPQEPRPSAARRVGVILLASLVAAAGFGLLLRARDMDDRTPATITSSPPPTGTPTGSAAPAPQGLVAFAAQPRGSTTGLVIAVMQPNGTGFRQLTGLPGDRDADPDIARYTYASDDSPSFSPDGHTIVFVRRYTEAVNSLCKIDVDGSNFRVVKRDAQMGEIAWSPDGRTIAFYSEQDGGIHLIDADGTNERTLWARTGGPNQDAPSWSPDSSLVYYASGGIWAARADGSGSRRVAEPARDVGWVALCPEGSPIAFAEQGSTSRDGAIWLADLDGSNLRRVTPAGSGNWYAVSWAPSGLRLLLVSDDGTAALIDLDGTHLETLPTPGGVTVAGPIAWWATVP